MKPEQGQVSYGLPIHFLMAFCGGFFGSYAVFNRMSVFGNAQTANLIELIGAVLGHDFPDALLRLGAFLVFVSALGPVCPSGTAASPEGKIPDPGCGGGYCHCHQFFSGRYESHRSRISHFFLRCSPVEYFPRSGRLCRRQRLLHQQYQADLHFPDRVRPGAEIQSRTGQGEIKKGHLLRRHAAVLPLRRYQRIPGRHVAGDKEQPAVSDSPDDRVGAFAERR